MSSQGHEIQEHGIDEFKNVELRDNLSFMVGVKEGVAYVVIRYYESWDGPGDFGKRAVLLEVNLNDLPKTGEGQPLPTLKVDMEGVRIPPAQ